jgi:hypothetical protein
MIKRTVNKVVLMIGMIINHLKQRLKNKAKIKLTKEKKLLRMSKVSIMIIKFQALVGIVMAQALQ